VVAVVRPMRGEAEEPPF